MPERQGRFHIGCHAAIVLGQIPDGHYFTVQEHIHLYALADHTQLHAVTVQILFGFLFA